jgi:hypothetical protein
LQPELLLGDELLLELVEEVTALSMLCAVHEGMVMVE